jgi:hypothetical protein
MPAKPRNWAFDVLEEHLETCKGASCAEVTLDGPITDEALEALSDRACFPKIVKLSLTNSGIQDAQAEKLVKAKNIRGIKHLGLTHGVLTDAAAKALAKAPGLKKLEHLDLSHNIIGARGAEAILQSKNLSNIHTLEFGRNRIGATLPIPDYDVPFERTWRRLDVSENNVDREHATAILESKHFEGIHELNIRSWSNLMDCLSKVAHSEHLGSLRKFEAQCHSITTSYRTMAESPHLTNLTHLSIYSGHIEDISALDGILRTDKAKNLVHISVTDSFLKGTNPLALISRARSLPKLRTLDLTTQKKHPPTLEETRRFFSSGLLGHLESFDHYGEWTPSQMAIMANSAEMRGLRELRLRGAKSFDDQAAISIATSPYLENLEVLDLTGSSVGDKGLEALARSPNMKNLRVLALPWTKITDAGVEALANSPHMSNLEELSLSGGVRSITSKSLIALSRSPHINKLTELDLVFTNARDKAFHEFVMSGNFTRLKRLRLSVGDVSSEEIILWTRSSMWRALENIDLHIETLSAEAIDAIANAPGSNNIETLRIRTIFEKGALAALESPTNLTRLSTLAIMTPQVDATEAMPLLRSPLLAQLSELDLSGCKIGDEGVQRLVSRDLPRLKRLSLEHNEITLVGAKALAQDPDLAHMTRFAAMFNDWGKEGFLALSESPYLAKRERKRYLDEANQRPPAEASETTPNFFQKLLR